MDKGSDWEGHLSILARALISKSSKLPKVKRGPTVQPTNRRTDKPTRRCEVSRSTRLKRKKIEKEEEQEEEEEEEEEEETE